LHLAQPTVSVQLKKLSEALGVPLIEWRDRRLHLTASGRELHAVCVELIGLFGRLEGQLAALRQPPPEPAGGDACQIIGGRCDNGPFLPEGRWQQPRFRASTTRPRT